MTVSGNGPHGPVTVPCTMCGKPTQMTGTKLCDSCWENDRRGAGSEPESKETASELPRPDRTPAELNGDEIRQSNTATQVLKHAMAEYERENGKLDGPAWLVAGVRFLACYLTEDYCKGDPVQACKIVAALQKYMIVAMMVKPQPQGDLNV